MINEKGLCFKNLTKNQIMPPLTGQQVGDLQRIVCNAFSVDELAQLVRMRLNETLENVVAVKEQSRPNIVFALIEWLEHRGRMRELLQSIRDERSQVAEICQFCDPLLAANNVTVGANGQAGAGEATDARVVLVRVVEFRTMFNDRRTWFDRLNAYKTLHDVLDKLQDQQVGIAQAAQRFHRTPQDTLELTVIADKLEDELIADAKSALPKTEFPEKRGKWVAAFEKAVQSLRLALMVPDMAALDRAIEVLATLRNQQAGLNEELINCVKRLSTDELIAKMQSILGGLGQIPAAKADDLRVGLTKFQELCLQLAALTLDHDACQEIDTSLAAVEPEGVTQERIFQWPDVLAALLRIAARRPQDQKAARMADYAKAFDKAADAKAATNQFTLLKIQFGRLFNKTDEDLLDITTALVGEANLLGVKLEGFAL
jgi:hypothetical protein